VGAISVVVAARIALETGGVSVAVFFGLVDLVEHLGNGVSFQLREGLGLSPVVSALFLWRAVAALRLGLARGSALPPTLTSPLTLAVVLPPTIPSRRTLILVSRGEYSVQGDLGCDTFRGDRVFASKAFFQDTVTKGDRLGRRFAWGGVGPKERFPKCWDSDGRNYTNNLTGDLQQKLDRQKGFIAESLLLGHNTNVESLRRIEVFRCPVERQKF